MIEFGQVPNENAQESLEDLFRFQSDKKATNLSIHTKLFLLEIVQNFQTTGF